MFLSASLHLPVFVGQASAGCGRVMCLCSEPVETSGAVLSPSFSVQLCLQQKSPVTSSYGSVSPSEEPHETVLLDLSS